LKWEKKGLIYNPDLNVDWRNNSALTPTPIILDDKTIRIYAGFRDKKGVSRIGYVDVDGENPSKIIKISEKPVLDAGKPGTFDDNGVILGDVIHFNNKLYMYYVGFQLVEKIKFLAFTGLAISSDNGESFARYSNSPILDRTNEELYIRAIHSIIYDNGVWKAWSGTGNDWQTIEREVFPKYNIRYYESQDGIHFNDVGISCINTKDREYRIGRPRVYKINNKYSMFYTYGTLDKDYLSGYAESLDGINWTRKDKEIGINLSSSGWDSKHLAYPSITTFNGRTFMFYNGNDMGYAGFGYAELAK
jgi:predicted GH43/DUF377 family glycosyl hydrolase